jgi:hypothetical protein
MVELFLVINCIEHALSKFNNNKLTLLHSYTCSKTIKKSIFKAVALEFVTITLVSSVKRTVLDLLLIMLGNQYINKEVQRSKN